MNISSTETSPQIPVPPLLIQSMQNLKIEKLNELLCVRITKIAHKYRPEGIPMDTIKYCYHKEFLYELNPQKLGFESIDDLISDVLAHNYPIEIRTDIEGIQRLHSNLRQYFYWLSVMKVSKRFEILDIMVDVPEDVIPCGQRLPAFQFPDSVEFNAFPQILSGNILNELNYSEVIIISANSPHDIYLQICGDNYNNSFYKLRSYMRLYNKRENDVKYRIPALLLMEGLLCAAKYGQICNEWHRSRIISIDKEDNVTLQLLDIGVIIVEKAVELRLLKKEFASFPAQAIKVQLTAIRPFGKSGQLWSNSAKTIVKSLQEDSYSGRIECAFFDFQKDRFRVHLKYYDRFKSKDNNDLVFLNQILVNKKLAVITGNDSPVN